VVRNFCGSVLRSCRLQQRNCSLPSAVSSSHPRACRETRLPTTGLFSFRRLQPATAVARPHLQVGWAASVFALQPASAGFVRRASRRAGKRECGAGDAAGVHPRNCIAGRTSFPDGHGPFRSSAVWRHCPQTVDAASPPRSVCCHCPQTVDAASPPRSVWRHCPQTVAVPLLRHHRRAPPLQTVPRPSNAAVRHARCLAYFPRRNMRLLDNRTGCGIQTA